ncbi:tetratricopeptide repeat protein [Methanocella paludicola]|nr:tetratricopeptide repeat protein [Methanocella paludicola]
MNRANFIHWKDMIDELIAEYMRALELDPYDAMAHFNLAIAHQDKNMLEEAIGEYKMARVLNPYDFKVQNNDGALHLNKGRMYDALL